MFVWLSERSCDGLVNDEKYNKLLKGVRGIGNRVKSILIGCAIAYWGFLFNHSLWGKG